MNSSTPESEVVKEAPKTTGEINPAVQFVGMVVAAAVATALSIVIVTSVGDLYPTPEEVLSLGGRPTEAELAASRTAQQAVDTGNAMVCLGICGAVLGGCFALTNGLLRRASMNIAIGAVAGILSGGALGILSGILAVDYNASVFKSLRDPSLDLNPASAEQQFMMMHGITWGLIGVGVGLGCSLSRRKIGVKPLIQLIIVAGVMGSIAGGLYPIVAGIVDPLVSSATPVAPPGSVRAVWVGLASILMAVGVSRAG